VIALVRTKVNVNSSALSHIRHQPGNEPGKLGKGIFLVNITRLATHSLKTLGKNIGFKPP
jgi:hypothetical protein